MLCDLGVGDRLTEEGFHGGGVYSPFPWSCVVLGELELSKDQRRKRFRNAVRLSLSLEIQSDTFLEIMAVRKHWLGTFRKGFLLSQRGSLKSLYTLTRYDYIITR